MLVKALHGAFDENKLSNYKVWFKMEVQPGGTQAPERPSRFFMQIKHLNPPGY